jgi:hypothetical protein
LVDQVLGDAAFGDRVHEYNAGNGQNPLQRQGLNKIKLPAELIDSFFSPVVQDILDHVNTLLQVGFL